MPIVFAFEKNTRRRSVFRSPGYTAAQSKAASAGVICWWPANLINAPRFFPWRQTFGQRAALSVDRPNAAHSAYQQQLHRLDRGPRKPASASVLVSSLQQSATSPPTRMFNFEQFWSWQPLFAIAGGFGVARRIAQSCRTTLRRDLLMWISPLYWIKPSFLNLFMKKLTRDRVVPIMSASMSCDTLGRTLLGSPGSP
jgi:hypothetical protein